MIIDILLLIVGALLIMNGCLRPVMSENKPTCLLIVIGTIIFSTSLTCMYYENDKDNEPTALDVYRNKTTLEITYKDDVAIDSTVVFKDKEK